MEYKVGDLIYGEFSNHFNVVKIEKIEGNKLWGFWSCNINTLPKTNEEFERLNKSTFMQFIDIHSKSLQGKLVFNINRRIS